MQTDSLCLVVDHLLKRNRGPEHVLEGILLELHPIVVVLMLPSVHRVNSEVPKS